VANLDANRVIRRVLAELGERELRLVRKAVGSRTLRAAMTLIIDESEQRADLFIPHYWAIWYHDGRGSVSPVSARKLVFFDNHHDDPRLRGGKRPVRESEVKRLTKQQYEAGLRENQNRARLGLRPFMWVVDSVGPAAPRPFFDQLSKDAARRAEPIVTREFERELLDWIDRDPDTKSETRITDIGFGL
jgi:hypothetical protein